MSTINWKATLKDAVLIQQIAERASQYYQRDKLDTEMDITACHLNGCPLDLKKLLAADGFNFAHDILGIERHMDRETGKLKDCFLPRCAKPSTRSNDD